MKRKIAVATLLCAMMMALSIGAAQATVYTCTVSGTGVTDSGYYWIILSDTAGTAFTNRNFLIGGPGINVNYTNQFFATALTAYANSTNVQVDLPDTTPWSVTSMIIAVK